MTALEHFEAAYASGGPPGDGEPLELDWDRRDLGDIARAIRNGDHQPTVPDILAVTGTIPLFYTAKINSLFGESGGGKTWVALGAVAEVVRNGDPALFVDYEDGPTGIAERLVLLGLTDDEIARIDYRNPTTGIGRGLDELTGPYRLAVIDSTGEAMAAGGVDSNADREVAQWFALVKRLLRLPGAPAVVILDHIPKDKDAPSAYAIGSQRKRAAVSGAAYRVDTLVEPAKGKNGKLRLTVAKDRLGNRPRGATAAEIDIRSTDNAVALEAHQSDAQAAHAAGQTFRPTVLMERVSRFLESVDEASMRTIAASVTGRREAVELAVTVLIDEGYVTRFAGPRGALIHRSDRPFRDEFVPENPPRPTASHRVPDAVAEAVDRVPLETPPLRGGSTGTRSAAGTGHGPENENVGTRSMPDPDELF